MTSSISENDWKYLRSIRDELIASLCRRINETTIEILHNKNEMDYDKYLNAYRHIKDSDGIVAECFNDWRRSTIGVRLISMQRNRLLTEPHLENLSEKTRVFIKWSETL